MYHYSLLRFDENADADQFFTWDKVQVEHKKF